MPSTTPTLGFLLHDVARLLRKRFEQRARDLGLTRAQWQALAYLTNNEGIPQGRLAELIDVEPITIGRIVDRLEARGLLERRQHPTDRRVWLLFLTEAARPLISVMRDIGDATRSDALLDVSEPERQQLLEVLGRMKTNLAAACATPVEDKEKTHG